MKRLCHPFRIFALTMLVVSGALANPNFPDLPDKGLLGPDNNKFMDPRVSYDEFMGRVTDKGKNGKVLKVHAENKNTKFFKAGDPVYFRVNQHDTEMPCRATVQGVDGDYFIIHVADFSPCWESSTYFPRGVQLNFESEILAQRVFEAGKYREILLLRKDGFLKQLSEINHFLWTYKQQRMKTAAEYDERINQLRKEKQLAVDNLLKTKQESLVLQVELMKKLDRLDESLEHYKVERGEYLTDRWNMDHDLGVTFPQRPPKIKKP